MTDSTKMKFDARVDEMRGRLKEAWGVLTDDDVDRAEGRWDRMIATIRQKSGETMETISSKIDSMIDSLQEPESSDNRS